MLKRPVFFSSALAVTAIQALLTLLVYWLTAFPSISGGDSGELSGVACAGGVAHPPGYPLWLLLARTTLSATGGLSPTAPSAARRLNLMSALLSAASAAVLMSTVQALGCSACTRLFWKQPRRSTAKTSPTENILDRRKQNSKNDTTSNSDNIGSSVGDGGKVMATSLGTVPSSAKKKKKKKFQQQHAGGEKSNDTEGSERRAGEFDGISRAADDKDGEQKDNHTGAIRSGDDEDDEEERQNSAMAASSMQAAVWGSVVAGALYSFSAGIWEFSIQAEVFALNNLLVALLLRLTVACFSAAASHRRLLFLAGVGSHSGQEQAAAAAARGVVATTAATAATSGLCLCNQHTSVLYVGLVAPAVVAVGHRALLPPWCNRSSRHRSAPPAHLEAAAPSAPSASSSSSSSPARSGGLSSSSSSGGPAAPRSKESTTLSNFARGAAPLALLSLSALLGLSPYLYLPLAAHRKAPDSWGDQRTVRGFLTHFLRREYGTFQLASDLGEDQDWAKIRARFGVFLRRFAEESGAWAGRLPGATEAGDDGRDESSIFASLPRSFSSSSSIYRMAASVLAIVGFVELLRPHITWRRAGASGGSRGSGSAALAPAKAMQVDFLPGGPLLVCMVVAYSLFINCLANLSFSALHVNITARMWQQAYMVGYVAIGVGTSELFFLLFRLLDLLFLPRTANEVRSGAVSKASQVSPKRRSGSSSSSKKSPPSSSPYSTTLVGALAVGIAARQAHCNWARSDESRNGSFLAYGRQLVGGLPRGAVLMVNDDLNCNLPHYVLRCEPWFRPDVQLVRLPLITYEWWRRMQLHHYTRTQDVNTLPQTHTVLDEEGGGGAGVKVGGGDGGDRVGTEGSTKGGEKKATKKPKKKRRKRENLKKDSPSLPLLSRGWRLYGSPVGLENDVEVSDQLAMYEQLVAAAETASRSPHSASKADGTAKLPKKKKKPSIGPRPVRNRSVVDDPSSLVHHHHHHRGGAAPEGKDAALPSKPTTMPPPPPIRVRVLDALRSLAFPGSRHHPYEKSTAGSFSMDEFLLANLFLHPAMMALDSPSSSAAKSKKKAGAGSSSSSSSSSAGSTMAYQGSSNGNGRLLFVAGDWKQGDDSAGAFQRMPCGLADAVLPPRGYQPPLTHSTQSQLQLDLAGLLFGPTGGEEEERGFSSASASGGAGVDARTAASSGAMDRVVEGRRQTRGGARGGHQCVFAAQRAVLGMPKELFRRSDRRAPPHAGIFSGIFAPLLPLATGPNSTGTPAELRQRRGEKRGGGGGGGGGGADGDDPTPQLAQLDPGTWEYVLATKYYTAVFKSVQFLAEHMHDLPSPTANPPPTLSPLPPSSSPPLSSSSSSSSSSLSFDPEASSSSFAYDGSTEVASGSPDTHEQRIVLLRAAYAAYGSLAETLCSRDPKSDFYCAPELWRNAGVVCGQLAADLSVVAPASTAPKPGATRGASGRREKKRATRSSDDGQDARTSAYENEETAAAEAMFRYWRRFVDETRSSSANQQAAQELMPMLQDAVNPFNQKHYSKPRWLKGWLRAIGSGGAKPKKA